MLSPSAAPRWKITTSFLPWAWALVAWASTDRCKKDGTNEVPTKAIAPSFINARRVAILQLQTRPRSRAHRLERWSDRKVVLVLSCFLTFGAAARDVKSLIINIHNNLYTIDSNIDT